MFKYETIQLDCPHCGDDRAVIYERGPHYRADCDRCHRYIKFVSKQEVYAQRSSGRYLE